MRWPLAKSGFSVVLAALLLAAIPIAAEAQSGQVTGTITDFETQAPLSTVQVYLEGTSRGVLSA